MRAADFEWYARGMFAGTLRWECPKCGLPQSVKLDYSSFEIRCKASQCKQWYVFGLRLLVTDGKKRKIPKDRIFPVIPVEDWMPGDRSASVEDDPRLDSPDDDIE